MVRKITKVFVTLLVLICGLTASVQARTYSVYENSTLSSTYTTYFKDIVSGIGFNDNYVAFRSGQYTYTMVVGDITYNNGSFTSNDTVKIYEFSTGSGYTSQYTYTVTDDDSFSLNVTDEIIYSDLGEYPQLIERGAKFEILQTFIFCVALLGVFIYSLFPKRER